jgi:hypothetical protein
MNTLKLSTLLLVSMLCNMAIAHFSHIKNYHGYELNDSVGALANLQTARNEAFMYLTSHENKFDIKTSKLKLKTSYISCGNYYLIYEQYHSGVRVHSGKVGIKINANGTIRKIGVRFYKNIPHTFPSNISSDNSITYAENIFKDFNSESVKCESVTQIIYPVDKKAKYILAWRVELSNLRQTRGEVFYISAVDGSLLDREVTIRNSINGTVEGDIWTENYFDTWNNRQVQSTVEEPFEHLTVDLDGTAYSDETDHDGDWAISQGDPNDYIRATLSGPFVTIHHSGGSEDEHYSNSAYTWTWDDMSNHCDEYNVFYHVNLIHDYFLDNFGYEWDYGGDTAIDAYVYVNNTIAAYYPFSRSIRFGIAVASGDPSQRYYARTSDVIYHEYTHAVKHDIDVNDNANIDEGFSE